MVISRESESESVCQRGPECVYVCQYLCLSQWPCLCLCICLCVLVCVGVSVGVGVCVCACRVRGCVCARVRVFARVLIASGGDGRQADAAALATFVRYACEERYSSAARFHAHII